MSDKNTNIEKVEQNNPKGAVLHSVKTDLMCGGMHQISVFRPTIIIDSHMHIQSGRCATLQFVQSVSIVTRILSSRKYIEAGGIAMGSVTKAGTVAARTLEYLFVLPYAAYQAHRRKKENDGKSPPIKGPLGELTKQSKKTTLKIGDDFMKERIKAYEEFFKKEILYNGLSQLVLSGVIMTMDMEYAHVDGYYGLKIYNALYESDKDLQKLNPCDYWTPVHGIWVNAGEYGEPIEPYLVAHDKRGKDQYTRTDLEGHPSYPNMEGKYTEFEKKTTEEMSIYGSYYDIKKKKTLQEKVRAIPVLTSKDERKKYEQWEKQLRYTELAMMKYPLKLLPLYHYDPRRYQPKGNENGNVIPLGKVTGDGLYLGFKMYTAQGYRPWDIRRLPILEDFYAKCRDGRIPIMNHGTPGGAATFDKNEYFDFDHPNDIDEDRKQKDTKARKLGATSQTYKPMFDPGKKERYFNEQFVSPEAWKKVLDAKFNGKTLNTLRLCLAHFGGPTKLGMEWNYQIVEMIKSGKYPNLYTDISSSFASDDFRRDFKKIITAHPQIKDRILFGTDWYLTLSYGLFINKDFPQYCRETKRFLDSFDISLWAKFTQYNPYRFYRLDEQIDRIARNIIMRRKTVEYEDILGPIEKNEINRIKKEAAYIKAPKQSYEIYEETPWRA